jgi:hypothetical protein
MSMFRVTTAKGTFPAEGERWINADHVYMMGAARTEKQRPTVKSWITLSPSGNDAIMVEEPIEELVGLFEAAKNALVDERISGIADTSDKANGPAEPGNDQFKGADSTKRADSHKGKKPQEPDHGSD